jgi:beta-lactamase regulating signal transducer with metallopeptidase domain
MDTIAKSDAFFFITTICVILVTVMVVVAGAYAIRIVSDVKYITKRAKKETDEIADDLKEAREHIKTKGIGLLSVLSSVLSFGRARKKRKD